MGTETKGFDARLANRPFLVWLSDSLPLRVERGAYPPSGCMKCKLQLHSLRATVPIFIFVLSYGHSVSPLHERRTVCHHPFELQRHSSPSDNSTTENIPTLFELCRLNWLSITLTELRKVPLQRICDSVTYNNNKCKKTVVL